MFSHLDKALTPELKKNLNIDLDLWQETLEVNNIIDYNIWDETIKIQDNFNSQINPNWKESDQDFWMAILDETIEVLNSRNWKWWKDTSKYEYKSVDKENIKVEFIDIFHFMLSIAIKENMEMIIYASFMNKEMNKDSIKLIDNNMDDFFNNFWNDYLMAVSMKNLPMIITKWTDFWYDLGYDAQYLFLQYRIKVALNKLRQEFGYTDGTYIKSWNGVEDNKVAFELCNNVKLDNNTVDNMFDILKDYYLKNIIL